MATLKIPQLMIVNSIFASVLKDHTFAQWQVSAASFIASHCKLRPTLKDIEAGFVELVASCDNSNIMDVVMELKDIPTGIRQKPKSNILGGKFKGSETIKVKRFAPNKPSIRSTSYGIEPGKKDIADIKRNSSSRW